MRLHLSIQRNALPSVDIVFSTGAGPTSATASQSTATIADLLHDVNALVPLESWDGEWALEDYVVEVAGKQKYGGKRQRRYECLHFQPLATVLREDDEVVIRAMGGDELKARRLGGRVQTARDGRHLVDGVVWGRRWMKESQRPKLSILPRKKRKLLTAVEHNSPLRVLDTQMDEDETSSSGSSASASDSDSDSDSDSGSSSGSHSSSGSGSGSGSDSGSDSDSDSSSEDSHLSSSSSVVESDYTSSSGSDSPFESDSSCSEESEVKPKVTLKKTAQVAGAEFATKLDAPQVAPLTTIPVTLQPFDASIQMPKGNPPGQGLPRTKRKNERTKMKRRLKALQEAGHLPAHATFIELREYEEAHHAVSTDAPSLADELEVAKARLLKGINEMEVEASPIEAPTQDTSAGREAANGVLPRAVEGAPAGLAKETFSAIASHGTLPKQETSPADPAEASAISPVKRAKLNIEASRRLLFGSLGLRTPKTVAEEQALREKLSQNIGPGKTNRPKESSRRGTASADTKPASSKSWKDKLIVTAVECVQENMILPPPPFPFVQHWHRKDKTDESQANLTLNYDGAASPPSKCTDQVKSNGYMPDIPTNSGGRQQDEVGTLESRTLSSEKESNDKHMPTNFEDLADLDRSQALPGTVIAYKEIHVGADTNFQPQVSAYRTAEIESVDKDGWVTVKLSKRDRRKNVPLDLETGRKISNNFEIEGSEDEVDDGVREMSWNFLLEPKLVQASRIQVSESAAQDSLGGEDGRDTSQQKGDAVVPESLNVDHEGAKPRGVTADAVQIEIGTPRRKEIAKMIREAGFDSAMDQHLIGPLLGDRNAPGGGSPQPSTGQADPIIETSRVAIEEIGPDGWISSPLQHGNPDMETDGHIQGSEQDPEPSSSPSVSLHLTVEYPHVSHLEHGESSTSRDGYTRNSSSHQDAQRVVPMPPSRLEFTDPPAHEVHGAVSEGADIQAEDSLELLPSRGPTTQSQDEPEENIADQSFLGGRGSDGRDSSYPKSGDEWAGSSSDSSLPSLSALTSSQKPKVTKSKMITVRKKQNRVKSTRPGKGWALSRIQASQASAEDAAEDDDIKQPAPSQNPIKISASQAEQPRSFSQIPLGTQVVDLTMTSSPMSPGNSDGEFRPNGLARATSGENAGRRQTRASSGAIDYQAGIGMGTKRFLTTRKKRMKAAGGYF